MINKLLGPLLAKLPENNILERIWILAKTDFKKRYYGTSLGIIWALINPLSQIIIYYYIFAILFKTDIPNFSLYLFSGLIFWMFFVESTNKGLNTFPSYRAILDSIKINKFNVIYSNIISGLFTLLFNSLVFSIVAIFFDLPITKNLLFLPLIIINLIILVLGVNLILSVLHLYLRDFQHFWDIFTMAVFWINPIVYSEQLIYDQKVILFLNPIAGMIINMHNAVIFGKSMDFTLLIWDLLFAFIVLLIGIIVFNKYSKKALEII
jgi:ABC-type polysaccharide/polyol phosphate export permease